jgi:co-chaperonin GroES (HSP10)
MNKETVQGLIDWWEFAPVKDLMLCKIIPDETTKKTESGLIISVSDSVVEDRPKMGVVISKGPEAPYDVGTVLFWTKNAGYDLKNIRTDENDTFYVLINPETVLGVKVKDTRK